MTATTHELLAPDEPPPVYASRRGAASEFIIACDHAGRRIPRALANLGVPEAELQRHIAWDIGALGIACGLSHHLSAPLVAQNYSRLVIDCNRDPRVASSIATVSEYTPVPGNVDLPPTELERRRRAIFDPYHDYLRAVLDERARQGLRTILVAQHTMTNIYKGSAREMQVAVLYNRDRRFAGLVLEELRSDPALVVGDNQPYFVSDETDYTIPQHGEARGLEHVEIEVRQDLVADAAGQAAWAARLAAVLVRAADRSRAGY